MVELQTPQFFNEYLKILHKNALKNVYLEYKLNGSISDTKIATIHCNKRFLLMPVSCLVSYLESWGVYMTAKLAFTHWIKLLLFAQYYIPLGLNIDVNDNSFYEKIQ